MSLVNDSMFWLSISTILTGIVMVSIKHIYKIKCADCIMCFGLIQCHRDINHEIDRNDNYDDIPMRQPTPTLSPSQKI